MPFFFFHKLDKPPVDRKETVAVESVKAAERPSISSEKSLFSSILNKSSSDAETSGTHVAAEKNTTAFTFPVAPVSSMTTVQPVGLASLVPLPLEELNAAPPVFSFNSKDHVKKAPPFWGFLRTKTRKLKQVSIHFSTFDYLLQY